MLLGNSPKGSPHDGGGAVWWIADPRRGLRSPRMVHRFEGLKPEGVCLASDRQGLILVFDRDQEVPLWTRLPLPR